MSYSWAAYQLHTFNKYQYLNKVNNYKSHILCIDYHRVYIAQCIPNNYYSSSKRPNFTLNIRRMCYYKELYLICIQGKLNSEQNMKYMIDHHIEELLSNYHFRRGSWGPFSTKTRPISCLLHRQKLLHQVKWEDFVHVTVEGDKADDIVECGLKVQDCELKKKIFLIQDASDWVSNNILTSKWNWYLRSGLLCHRSGFLCHPQETPSRVGLRKRC